MKIPSYIPLVANVLALCVVGFQTYIIHDQSNTLDEWGETIIFQGEFIRSIVDSVDDPLYPVCKDVCG